MVAAGNLIFPVRRARAERPGRLGEVLERGYEGYVAKDEASAYADGKTKAWLKVKVPGWTDPEDRWQRVMTRS
jgi:hypothetical protein